MKNIFLVALFCIPFLYAHAQDDLLNLLDEDSTVVEQTVYTTATFKGSKIINTQTNEMNGKGDLQFIILHRFGALNEDYFYNFFGLEQANTRFSFDYSFTDWLNVGVGRSSASKTYDGFIKAKILRQSTGARFMPIAITGYASINYTTLRWEDDLPHSESERFSYSYQLLISRRCNDWLSLQLAPTLIHYNVVQTAAQPNDVFALGFGGRIKISQRIAITGEYMLQLPKNTYLNNNDVETQYKNSASIGVDIETGGHVFQIHLTNSLGMVDPQWVGRTSQSWANGGVHLGFNISRVFTVVKPKEEEPMW